jgi:hypothetical protein
LVRRVYVAQLMVETGPGQTLPVLGNAARRLFWRLRRTVVTAGLCCT